MVHAGRDHSRAAGADRPGVRRDRLDGGHTARLDGRCRTHRVVRPFRHRRLGGRRARKRQCGPGRAELERHRLVVGAHPHAVGQHPGLGFKSVAASSASDAWAVGEQSSGTKIHDSLYEHWNGTAWSVVAGPNEGILNAVLDFSPANAWAFADFSVLHWNGTAWSVVSGALPALAVSADGPGDIWGIYRNDQVTHYNGTSWSLYTLSGPSGTAFESVVALSPADVWAGGTNGTGPLLEHFNGTSWHVMTTPSSFAGAGVLAMTAKSDSDVWIFSVHNPLTQAVLLANWNGSSWTTSPSPIPADSSVSIGSAASSPSHVWLFGTDDTTGEPMILSHS